MSQRPPDSVPSLSRVTSATTDDPASVDLDEVLRPHSTRRRRAVQAGSVLALLLVVVWALLRGVVPPPFGSASTVPSGGAPMPPTVVITANISFGVVTLNGTKLAGSLPLATTAFRTGANVVTLSAPPFLPLACTISVSGPGPATGWAELSSGCSIETTGGTLHVNGADLTPDFTVVLSLDSTDLPSDQAAQAYATTTQAIAAVPPRTTIPSDQYYAVGIDPQGHLIARRAATPLQADVLVGAPDPQEQSGSCSAHRLCAVPAGRDLAELFGDFAPAGRRTWDVEVGLTLSWRYTAPAGAVTRSPQLPFSTAIQLVLTQDPGSGTWSVFSPPSAPVGGSSGTGAGLPTLGDEVTFGLCDIGSQLVDVQGQHTYRTLGTHNQGVAGCEIQVHSAPSSATVLGTFLWRFGVLLAVDNGAHTLAPWLPLAPQSEIAAVGG